jgi:hypothetical protein
MDRAPFAIADFDEVAFESFCDKVSEAGENAQIVWNVWEDQISGMDQMNLMADPSTNLPVFWAQLEEVQRRKNEVVTIIMGALFEKSKWESLLGTASTHLRHARAKLVSDPTVKAMKNKDMQEARMHDLRPDIYDMHEYCTQMLAVLKTIIQAFDKKLELLDSANLNINRQITVAELLSYKGLL